VPFSQFFWYHVFKCWCIFQIKLVCLVLGVSIEVVKPLVEHISTLGR
jgi:hypothetical protein